MGVTPRRIVVEIDELVLDGFPHLNRDRVTSAFRGELTRLLHQDAAGLVADRAHDEVTGLAMPPSSTARGLGEAIARAVHSGLTGEPG